MDSNDELMKELEGIINQADTTVKHERDAYVLEMLEGLEQAVRKTTNGKAVLCAISEIEESDNTEGVETLNFATSELAQQIAGKPETAKFTIVHQFSTMDELSTSIKGLAAVLLQESYNPTGLVVIATKSNKTKIAMLVIGATAFVRITTPQGTTSTGVYPTGECQEDTHPKALLGDKWADHLNNLMAAHIMPKILHEKSPGIYHAVIEDFRQQFNKQQGDEND